MNISFKQILEGLTFLELERVKEIVEEEIERRKAQGFEFVFITSANRKHHPYVAKLKYNTRKNKIEREFFNLQREYKGNKVSVHGTYKAKTGTVIEYRRGSEERIWNIVNSKGQLIPYTKYSNNHGKQDIINYLKGSLTLEDIERKLEEDEDRYLF